jgi:oxygen-dependent protoporphyrinogen oxidase
MKRIAIIGGGIAGIAAALELERLSKDLQTVLFEGSERLGGVLRSEAHVGFTIEHSADMFTTDPSTALDLVKRLGRENELLTTLPTPDRAYVSTDHGIEPIPRGLSLMLPSDVDAVLASNILSADGKERFLQEESVPAKTSTDDESLEDFAIRRFGREVFDRLIQPLAGGIYTADPKMLSMNATMKRFLDMEQEHGSLIGAAKAKTKNGTASAATSGARYGLFRAPKDGIGSLIDWMVEALESTQMLTNQKVTSAEKVAGGWQIKTATDSFDFDGIVLATSARTAGELLKPTSSSLGQTLATITAASSAIVVQAFDQIQFGWKPPAGENFSGYGIIVPHSLGRPVIASSFSSNKFPGRAPEGKMLVRSFIGGALNAPLVDLADDKLAELSVNELQQTAQLSGGAEWTKVYRWRNCMPQYTIGHLDRVAQIESLVDGLPGIQLAGNSYRGVGIPACIDSGFKAATRLLAGLNSDHP